MFVAYSLPVEPMRKNVAKSVEMMLNQREYWSWLGTGKLSYTISDGFSDAIMLSNATFDDNGNTSTINKAMLNPRGKIENKANARIEALAMQIGAIEKNDSYHIQNYSRYWHGYLIFLKPLLMIFNVAQIRLINFFIQFILTIIVILKFFSLTNYKYALAFACSLLVIDPVSTAVCFHYSDVYYITMISILIIMFRINSLGKNSGYIYLFLLNGVCIAFFDLLTYPVTALGLPLTIFLIINNCGTLKQNLYKIFQSSVAWGFGYMGMWAGKWIMSSILTNYNTLADALNQVIFRIAGKVDSLGGTVTWKLVFQNITRFKHLWPAIFLFCIVLVLIPVIIFVARKLRNSYTSIIPIYFMSFYPFIWFGIVQNDSIIHGFTHKSLSITIFAVLCVIIKCTGDKNFNAQQIR